MAFTYVALGAALVATCIGLDVPPFFIVDLSKPPVKRWEGALEKILERHAYEYSFKPVFENHAPLFDSMTAGQKKTIATAVRQHFPDTAQELQGIAVQFAATGHEEVTFEYLALWLYFHELAHTPLGKHVDTRECTGIIAESESGDVFHGGNMDQSPPAARNLTLRVRFVDGSGQTVFDGVDFYTLLSTGVSRAVKRGVATVQENWRSSSARALDDVIADISMGVISQMLVFRQTFIRAHESPMTFNEFVEDVTRIRLAAPFYMIVGGPASGDGVVIARSLNGSDGTSRLSESDERAQVDDYFLAQCNTDRWLPDNPSDPRRTAAELTLRRLGSAEGASMLGLMAVSSTYPVHNPHSAYTALMSAATGEMHAYVREASCPTDIDATIVPDARYCSRPVVSSDVTRGTVV